MPDSFRNSSVNSLGAIAANGSKSLKKGPTLTRSFTRQKTNINQASRQPAQATTEIFCHYLVPIFQFKRKVQPGKYEFPFNFQFAHLQAPTTDYAQNNFKLKIKYMLIAEVEEEPDDDSFAEEEELEDEGGLRKLPEKKPNLRCLTNLDVFWDYKKHMGDDDLYSEQPVTKKWNFTMPRPLCCFLKYKINADVSIPNSIITSDSLIPFTLKLEGAPSANDIEVKVNLFEEVSNNLIEYRDTCLTNLSMNYKKEVVNGTIVFRGDIDLGTRMSTLSLRSDDWNISHALEFSVHSKAFLSKHQEKIVMPCLIIPQIYQKKETRKVTTLNFLNVPEQSNDERMTLVHSKFKLEERYDIIRNQNFSNAIEHEDE